MTPEEKAKELVDKYKFYLGKEEENIKEAKDLSLITVDEIINANPSYDDYGGDGWVIIDNTGYWKKVKQEIQNL
jgi:hypothetical protein